IPPLAGFFGKFYIFAAAIKSGAPDLGLLWLVIFAIAMSAVSLYYYLLVLKQIYVVETPTAAATIRPSWLTQIVLGLLALLVVILGVAPNLILERLLPAIQSLGH